MSAFEKILGCAHNGKDVMKLRVEDVANIIDASVKTIYNHRKAGKVSFDKDGNGIESSEVERAYKDKYPDIGERIIKFLEDKNSTNEKKIEQKPKSKQTDESEEVALLKQELELLGEQIAKERKLYENHIADLKESLSKAQDGQNGALKLLEDKRDEEQLAAPWKKEIEAIKETHKNDNEENKLLKEKLKQFEEKQEEEVLQIRKKIKLHKKELPEKLKRLEGQGADISLLELEMNDILSTPVTNNLEELKEIHADLRDLAKRMKTEFIKHKKQLEAENKKSLLQKLFG